MADLYLDEALTAVRPLIEEEIRQAWNDGYKAGAMDYGPDSAYWEATAAVWSSEAKRTGPTWGTVAIAGAGGLVVGFGAGVLAAAAIFAAVR